MKKNTLLRLTAIEFSFIMLVSIAAVEAYDCHIIFVASLLVSFAWYIYFFIANGVIS